MKAARTGSCSAQATCWHVAADTDFRFATDANPCTHVLGKEATIKFYQEALGMKVVREMGPEDGSWTNTFMANDEAPFEIELTWNRGQVESYDNGGKDTHIAFAVDDFDAFHELHEKMGCIIRENPRMGLYFIADPDGQWIEIFPAK